MTEPTEEGSLVLLVDDDDDLLEIYSLALRRAGFRIETATDGFKALEKIQSIRPDVVVLDLMMPNCSGFEVLLHLQELQGVRPPVIVMSGVHKDAMTVDRIRLEPIVFEFLFKPVKHKDLVDVVRRAIPAQTP